MNIPSPLLFPSFEPLLSPLPELPDPAVLPEPSLLPLPDGEAQIVLLEVGSRGTDTSSMMVPTYVPRVSDLLTFLPMLNPLLPLRMSLLWCIRKRCLENRLLGRPTHSQTCCHCRFRLFDVSIVVNSCVETKQEDNGSQGNPRSR